MKLGTARISLDKTGDGRLCFRLNYQPHGSFLQPFPQLFWTREEAIAWATQRDLRIVH